ncbi:MAG: hypothetical protein ACYCXK_07315 [Candidatus Humimicrobiaceae bacterium]
MAKKLNVLRLAAVYMLAGLAVTAAASYLIFGLKNMNNFISIIIAAAIVFIMSFATIVIYKSISQKEASAAAKFIFLSFIGKLAIIAGIFFLLIKTGSLNLIYFFVSFVIFFTILLNVEIYLMYKKILFEK